MPENDLSEVKESLRDLGRKVDELPEKMGQTYVRQDNHSKDMQLLREILATHMRSTEALIGAVVESVKSANARIDKIDGDSDWLKKLIYSALILTVLAAVGFSGALTSGAFK
jgi:hypothetical protein